MGFSLRLQTFCFYFTLKTGSYIIGVLGCVGFKFSVLFVILQVGYLCQTLSPLLLFNDEYNPYIIVLNISACLLAMIIHVLYFVGLYKKYSKLLLPWLTLSFVEGIILILRFTDIFAYYFQYLENDWIFIIVLVAIFTNVVFWWYCWLCIWSYYKDLKELEVTVFPHDKYVQMNMSHKDYELV